MEDTGAGNVAEDAAGIARETIGQFGPRFAIERPGEQSVSVGFITVAVGLMMMPMVLVGAFVGLVGRADGQIRQLPETVG